MKAPRSKNRRTPPRDPKTGMFRAKASRAKEASEPRAPRRAAPKAKAKPKTSSTAMTTSRPAPRSPRAPRSGGGGRSAPRAPKAQRNAGIVLMKVGGAEEMGRPRRRPRAARRQAHGASEHFHEAMRATGPGGLALLAGGLVLGAQAADLLDRKVATLDPTATPAPQLPTGIPSVDAYNMLVLQSKPSGSRIAWQVGLAAVGILAGVVAPWAPVKMVAFGFGLGALGHVSVQVINAYLIEPMFGVNPKGPGQTATPTPAGREMFQAEANANLLLGVAGPPPEGNVGAPPAQEPQRAPRGLPANQPISRLPQALATLSETLGNVGAPAGATSLAALGMRAGGGVPPQPQRAPAAAATPAAAMTPLTHVPSCSTGCACLKCKDTETDFTGAPPQTTPAQRPNPLLARNRDAFRGVRAA